LRVKAVIEYNGSKFYGFQRQKTTKNSIAETIELALSSLGIFGKIRGSGRTDRGVHATGQVVDFELPKYWQNRSLSELKYRLNQKLGYIRFKYIKEVDNSFHSQYSAKVRVYRYLIKTSTPNIFESEFISYYNIKNIKLLEEALNLYIGRHNFKYFKKEGSVTSSDIREVYKIKVVKLGSFVAIYFFANGYLRSQIRLMIEGALKVERGELNLNKLKEQLELKQKHFTTLAQPQGLYLHKVFYWDNRLKTPNISLKLS